MKFVSTLVLVFVWVITAQAVDKNVKKFAKGENWVTIEIDGQFPAPEGTDVLFVIDDSASMAKYQESLSLHIPKILKAAQASGSDFHIGVTSTNQGVEVIFPPSTKPGELIGEPSFLTPDTPNLREKFNSHFLLGKNGSSVESVFVPVMEAFSKEMSAGVNKGFYRPDAHLSIVFLTDTDDQSDVSPWEFADYLVQLKGGDPSKITLQAIGVPVGKGNSCKGEMESLKIEGAVRLLKGDLYSVCDIKRTTDMYFLAKKLFPTQISTKPYVPGVPVDFVDLIGTPIVSTIKVSYGSQVLKRNPTFTKGWSYDAIKNQVVFDKDIQWFPQPKGTKIEVKYKAQ